MLYCTCKLVIFGDTMKKLLCIVLLVFSLQVFAKNYTAKLSGTIEDGPQTTAIIQKVNSLKPGDKLTIYVNSGGGYIGTGYAMVEAIHNSKGAVIVRVNKWAASMAANLMCEAPYFSIADNAVVMFHLSSSPVFFGLFKKMNKKGDNPFTWTLLHKTFKKCKFLTDKDIEVIDSGKEVWLSGYEINERLGRI